MRHDRSRPASLLSAAAGLIAANTLLATLGGCYVRPSPASGSRPVETHPGGSLFSTIPCADTPLGREWSKLRAEAEARFPGLRLTRVEDLHITVVYIGASWKLPDLDPIRSRALVGPREAFSFRPEIVRMGRNGHVVAAEMHGAPEAWVASVVAAKGELNRLGLKKPDAYDSEFRPHVTLASARRSPPDIAETAALDELRFWLAARVSSDPRPFSVIVGPATPVHLWLAGTERPSGSAEYIDLADALPRP
jgi:2'-5' RNA ligase